MSPDRDADQEAKILSTWHQNVDCWTKAVRQQQIESRRRVTDRAVVEAVLAGQPKTVLDLGCGEGWLTRSLTRQGLNVLGLDGVAGLVEQAQALGGGEFLQLDYGAIVSGQLQRRFDRVVCNFSLFGRTSVAQLLGAVPRLLNPAGALVIQTLHPESACGDLAYEDGWREGSWAGFSEAFVDPAPWYFRTVESWVALLERSGFGKVNVQVPCDPNSRAAASLILVSLV